MTHSKKNPIIIDEIDYPLIRLPQYIHLKHECDDGDNTDKAGVSHLSALSSRDEDWHGRSDNWGASAAGGGGHWCELLGGSGRGDRGDRGDASVASSDGGGDIGVAGGGCVSSLACSALNDGDGGLGNSRNADGVHADSGVRVTSLAVGIGAASNHDGGILDADVVGATAVSRSAVGIGHATVHGGSSG